MKKRAWLYLLFGALAFTLSSGRWNVAICAWIWPFAFLSYSRSCQSRASSLLLSITILLCNVVRNYEFMASGIVVDSAFALFLGLFLILPFKADQWLSPKLYGLSRTLVLPLSFASCEFLQSLLPTGPYGTVAATQADGKALIQLASVLGPYGVSFLVIWFGSVLWEVVNSFSGNSAEQMAVGEVNKPIICFVSLYVLTLVLGGARLAFAPYNAPSVKFALTTGPYNGEWDSEYELPLLLQSLNRSVETASQGGGDILMFCEEAFCLTESDEEDFLATASALAKKHKLPLLLGLEIACKEYMENKLIFINAQGEREDEYHKCKLIPVMEDEYRKGDGHIPSYTLETARGITAHISPIICFDADFPAYVRNALPAETDILMIPCWDWEGIRAYHTKWVEYRSVENGVSMVRSTCDGISTATDPYGRVLLYSDTARTGFENVVFAEVPVQRSFAPYGTIGPVVDWLYVLGFAVLVGIALAKRQKTVA